jgi:hypothetical protein
MLKFYASASLLIAGSIWLGGCAGSKLGSAKKGEKVVMTAPPKRDVINYFLLKQQQKQPLTLAGRAEIRSRGAATAFTGGLLSLGISAVRQVIANEQKKYTAEWGQGLNDLYFYDQPSAEGPFDPVGMQFNGFNITRTFSKDGQTVAALSADFEVDKDSVQANEIINDGFFRLKLKDIKINYSKAKVPKSSNTVNLDFDIDFITSYIDQFGNLHKDVDLGKFFLSLRKAPLDSTAADYKQYYDKLKNKRLDGKAFIVPRSFGHYKTQSDSVVALYNQGMFSIAVNVRESSRNNFVNQMLINTTNLGLNYGQSALMDKIKKNLK